MRAVRVSGYGGPEVLEVEEVPVPAVGPGQVLLKVVAGGINPLDAWFRSGHLAPRFPRPLPYTPGADVVGTLVERGEGVDAFQEGETLMGVLPVLDDGAYAEYVLAEAARLIALPPGLDPVLAAAVMTPGITGLQIVEKALSLDGGHRLLVLGALGGVGRVAVAAALEGGAEITAAVRPGREDAVRALGVEQVVTTGDPAGSAKVKGAIDVVLDLVGPDAVEEWEDAIVPNGTVISVVPLPPARFQRKDVTTIHFAFKPDPQSLATIAAMARDGKFTMPRIEVLGLDETGKAHALLPGNAGGRKFVVDPAR